jgi:hypothetical protein
MKEKILYALWACLYILCVGLGTVGTVEGIGKIFFVLTALIFFIPGILLVVFGLREKNKKMLLRVRIVCICSLVLTLIFLVANFLTANASDATGYAMFELLNLVSAPMLCSQYWILSLFLWACLLMASFTNFQGKKG